MIKTIDYSKIDDSILSLILEYNFNHFITISSCAGHGDTSGWVTFEKDRYEYPLEQEEIWNMAKNFGLKDLRMYKYQADDGSHLTITFGNGKKEIFCGCINEPEKIK